MKFEFNHLEKSVLDSLSKKGRVYLVGGIVRDMVMYQKVDYHDVDVEIYDLEIDEIIDILSQYGKVNEVGKSFGILKLDCLPNFDFALPRIERKKGQTHREFEVEVHKDLDMKTACCRRDFTINAMMYDYQNGKLIDYYQGREDIKNKCLKMVDEKTFYEDPLRVLRLAQFMSRFEFQVDLKTKEICQKMVNEGVLQYLSLERIQQEYNKLLMSSHPSTGLKFLLELNALIRPLETLVTCPQRLDFHPEGNVMNHTLLVVDLAALCKDKTSWPLAFMWSALLHDIGKPVVAFQKNGKTVFYNHGKESRKIAEKRLPESGIEGSELKKILFYIEHHDDFISFKLKENIKEDKNGKVNPFIIPVTKENVEKKIHFVQKKCKEKGIYIPTVEDYKILMR